MEVQGLVEGAKTAPYQIWVIFKIFTLIGIGLYIIFAAVAVRQVYLMTSTLKMSGSYILQFLVWAHLGAGLILFLLAALTL